MSNKFGQNDPTNVTKDVIEIIREQPASLIFRLTTKNISQQKHSTTQEVVKALAKISKSTGFIKKHDNYSHNFLETSNLNVSLNENKKNNYSNASNLTTSSTNTITTKRTQVVISAISRAKVYDRSKESSKRHQKRSIKQNLKDQHQDHHEDQISPLIFDKEDDNIDFEIQTNEPDRMKLKRIKKSFK